MKEIVFSALNGIVIIESLNTDNNNTLANNILPIDLPFFILNSLTIENTNFLVTDDPINIEVERGCNATIKKNEVPLTSINIKNGTLTFSNHYKGKVTVDITIGNNSSITQTGENLPIGKVILDSNAKLNFTHNDSSYSIYNNNSNYSTQLANTDITVNMIEVNNIHSIVETAINLKNQALDHKTLKSYYKNKEILSIFAQQNYLLPDQKNIDSYINQNYFKLTAIAKSLKDSDLGILNFTHYIILKIK